MSRGTARSIRSSGRPVAPAHHQLELGRARSGGAASRSSRRRCRAARAGRAGRRSARACRRSAGPGRSRGCSGGWRRRRPPTPRARQRPGGQLRGLARADQRAPGARRRSPRLRCASSTATEGIETPFSPTAGLGAGALAGGEGAAEQPVQDRAGGALDERQLVGALHLALDLGLADDHRVEPGGDPEEVPRRPRRRAASRAGRAARSGGSRPRARARRAPAVSASTVSVATR